jgi:hypothetical protein
MLAVSPRYQMLGPHQASVRLADTISACPVASRPCRTDPCGLYKVRSVASKAYSVSSAMLRRDRFNPHSGLLLSPG